MRLLLDILAALMVVGILAGVVAIKRDARAEQSQRDLTRQEVKRFQTQVLLQSALSEDVSQASGNHPQTIDPAWFKGNLPHNYLLGPGHPWCEIAGESQRGLHHPPDRTAANDDTAAFWYSPFTGEVRARVPVGISDAQALELYNFINDSNLRTLFTAP
jgi:type II secretory pathway pseudopilin PulG